MDTQQKTEYAACPWLLLSASAYTSKIAQRLGNGHIQGRADEPVTLVECGDYECPYCAAAYPLIKEVQARLGERLRFVFRHFPIRTSHPHPEQAAEAAEAAATQGKFWQMHDLPYEHQRRLRDQDLRAYAEALGLDVERFDQELAEHVHADRIHQDFLQMLALYPDRVNPGALWLSASAVKSG